MPAITSPIAAATPKPIHPSVVGLATNAATSSKIVR